MTSKTRTKTTRTTDREPACYYSNEECAGGLWQCGSCREWFCMGHSHVTEKGHNKECVACERERKDAELLNAEDGVERRLAKANVLDNLDIQDK